MQPRWAAQPRGARSLSTAPTPSLGWVRVGVGRGEAPGRLSPAGAPSLRLATAAFYLPPRPPLRCPRPGAPGGHLARHPRGAPPPPPEPARGGGAGPSAPRLRDRSPGARPGSRPRPPSPGAGPGSREAGTRPVAAASGPAAGAGRLPAGGAGASRCPLQPPPPGRRVAGAAALGPRRCLPGALRGRRCCPRSCRRRRRRRCRLRQPRRRPL